MSTIDCARFEGALAEALGSPGGADAATLAALRRHAATCASCGGSGDLVELAGRAASERDPVPDPGPEYWARFETRLAARLAAPPHRFARSRWLGASFAAVAVAGLVLAGLLAFRSARIAPSRSELPGFATPPVLPSLDEPVEEGDDADAFAEVDGPALFPGVEDLSVGAQDELLLWLEAEEARVNGGPA